MKPIRIFRHVSNEGPGYLATFLDQRRIPYQIVAIDEGAAVPPQVDDIAGLVLMGGPMSVNDPLPWIAEELQVIRAAVDRGLPVLGHCLGAQLISRALGGVITTNKVKEIGWFEVERMANPTANDWLDGIPPRFEVFHWHGETFSLPPGAAPLLTNAHCDNQAFALGNTLALQCHVEMLDEMVADWAQVYAADIAPVGSSVQTPAQMTTDLPRRTAAMQLVADRLYARWLR
jgi:GMP synthase-like glutamine amidotransferase